MIKSSFKRLSYSAKSLEYQQNLLSNLMDIKQIMKFENFSQG